MRRALPLLLLLSLGGCSFRQATLRVIDAETRTPLEGVRVAYEEKTPSNLSTTGPLHDLGVTDAEGKLVFPIPWNYHALHLRKSGYASRQLSALEHMGETDLSAEMRASR